MANKKKKKRRQYFTASTISKQAADTTKGALIEELKHKRTHKWQKTWNVPNIPHPNLNLSIYSEIICLFQCFVSV